MLSHGVFSPVVTPRERIALRKFKKKKKKECTWIDLTKCSLHKRYKFQLAYSILFAYFIALLIGPPRPLYSGWFGLCRGSGTKSNTKFQKPEKQIYKKNSKLHAKYKVPVLFAALLFFLFKTIIVLTSFFFSPLSWGQLKLKAEECEKRIYCYSVILFLVIKIWKANVEILYSLVLASLNGKQPVDIYWA